MAAKSKIEWLADPTGRPGATWNIVAGCTRANEECDRCYAMHMARRFDRPGMWGEGLTRLPMVPGADVDWSGVVRPLVKPLEAPLTWIRGRRVFVCSTSDLFHPKVPYTHIAAAFGVMAAARQHQFLVLTKRPQNALDFFRWIGDGGNANIRCMELAANRVNPRFDLSHEAIWPLPNVHVGVSAGSQERFDRFVPILGRIPAAVRWVSIEPQIERVRISAGSPVDWVVTGGESGSRARPYDMDWARSLIADCRAAEIPIFVKQLGRNPHRGGVPFLPPLTGKGADPREWPPDLRVQEYPR